MVQAGVKYARGGSWEGFQGRVESRVGVGGGVRGGYTVGHAFLDL